MYYPTNYYQQYAGSAMMQPPPGLKGRPVSSLEEARAANIDFDGSLFVFPDIANKKIYTKQINLDGTASIKVYSQIDNTPSTPAYVTKEEFDSTIKNLESMFSERRKDNESNSTTSSNQSISF